MKIMERMLVGDSWFSELPIVELLDKIKHLKETNHWEFELVNMKRNLIKITRIA